eukprot:scaffold27400_cov178-Skeletonema_dohrnii-CCMP3373.AAC.2
MARLEERRIPFFYRLFIYVCVQWMTYKNSASPNPNDSTRPSELSNRTNSGSVKEPMVIEMASVGKMGLTSALLIPTCKFCPRKGLV